MKTMPPNRYESIPKRSFRNVIIRLLEENYRLLGSHKVIQMIADDVCRLHKEFYPEIEKESFGHIVWRTTKATKRKPSYGTKAEDYEVQTVILPLITDEDIDNRIKRLIGILIFPGTKKIEDIILYPPAIFHFKSAYPA